MIHRSTPRNTKQQPTRDENNVVAQTVVAAVQLFAIFFVFGPGEEEEEKEESGSKSLLTAKVIGRKNKTQSAREKEALNNAATKK